MDDKSKTRDTLLRELTTARERIATLEESSSNARQEKTTLRESTALYNSLMEHSLDGIYIHDLEGKFIDANPAALKMLGYTHDDIMSLHLSSLIADDQLVAAEQQNEELVETGTYDGLAEFCLKRKDGSRIWVETKGSMIYLDGEPHSVIGIARDITQRKKMHKELAEHRDHLEKLVEDRTAELQSANKQLRKEMAERKKAEKELIKASKLESLGIFAGGIAHDFNNLLTAVVGSISLAKCQLDKDSKIYSILSSAETASFRTKDLTLQLLTFSKGGSPIKKTTSIGDLLNETVIFILRGSNISSELRIDENLWNANVDAGQLSQVVYNTLINARQAMPDGGKIIVSAENVCIDDGQTDLPCAPGNYVKISIEDFGIGIPKKNLTSIFDPYFTTKAHGSGLGLAVSYSIIKNHGGHIEASSTEGKGTVFSLYVPGTTSKIPASQREVSESFDGGGRILVMDDETLVLETAVNMLSQLGFDAVCTKTANEAVGAYQAAMSDGNPFAATIMDLTIPGDAGGKSAVDTIRKMDPDVKAIVSSGYSNNPVMANHRAYGFSGVLPKPYSFEDLVEALHLLLEN